MMRLRTCSNDQRGFTLVEMLVSMAILGVLLTAVVLSSITIQRTSATNNSRLGDAGLLRVALGNLARDIRAADEIPGSPLPAVQHASSDRVVFTANLDDTGRPLLVQIADGPDDAGERAVIQTTWTATAASSAPDLDYSTTPTERFVGRELVNDASEPLFRYYDVDGNELVALDPVVGLDEAQRRQVARVGMFVAIQTVPNSRVERSVISTSVRIANA